MTDLSSDTCPICLEHCEKKWQTNACAHFFCFECIETWANNTNKCPLCKTPFTLLERVGARTISSASTNTKKRVTRSQVDRDATIEVKERILRKEFDRDELLRLGLSEEEIAANEAGGAYLDAENNFVYDGWLVIDAEFYETYLKDDDDDDDDDDNADENSVEIVNTRKRRKRRSRRN